MFFETVESSRLNRFGSGRCGVLEGVAVEGRLSGVVGSGVGRAEEVVGGRGGGRIVGVGGVAVGGCSIV